VAQEIATDEYALLISLILSFVLNASVVALELLGKSVPAVLLGAALVAAGLSCGVLSPRGQSRHRKAERDVA